MYRQNYVDSETTYNCLDEDNEDFGFVTASTPDNIFGIKRNKEKKAERKIAKAEKQLEKGHTKAAARKLAKGTKLLNEIQSKQTAVQMAQQQIQDVKSKQGELEADLPRINAVSTKQNESLSTQAGQIGSEAGATTMPASSAALQSMGGGGGDIPQDTSADYTPANGETSTDDAPKQLPGVTVTASKTNWVLIIGIAAAAIILLFVIIKSKSKK
jgi:hypothetical protein